MWGDDELKYYYDVTVNFDEVPIPYYEWNHSDSIERVLKIPVIKVLDIKEFILYHMQIETELKTFILADGINAIALEIINGEVAYLSYLSYEDENCVNELVRNMECTEFKIRKKEKRRIPFILRKEATMQRMWLAHLEEMSLEELKYIYYEVTSKEGRSVDKMKSFLKNDILYHFNDLYVNLYKSIVN